MDRAVLRASIALALAGCGSALALAGCGSALALAGCGSNKREAPRAEKAPARTDASRADAAPPLADAGAPAGETAARVLLARMFREAGLRIRHDVHLAGDGYDVTLDGFDPRRKIGFEYIDPRERGADVQPSERQAMERAGLRVLVVDGATQQATAAAARRFLDEAMPKDAGP